MTELFLFYYFLPLLFSFLWFINLVQLLEKLKQNRDIKNQKNTGFPMEYLLNIFDSFISIIIIGIIRTILLSKSNDLIISA